MDKLLYFSRLYHYITVNMSSYKTNEIELLIKKNSNKIFKLLANAGILVRKMNSYGIKNSLRVTIGKSFENKKLILKIKKATNV